MDYLKLLRSNLGKGSVLLFFLFAFLYIAIAAYSINSRLVLGTISGSYSLIYKLRLLSSLLPGIYTAMSLLDFYLLLFASLLVGFNFVLLFLTIKNLKQSSNVSFLVGGASILSIAAVGCTSCGLSILSVLGFSAALAILPFDGLTLHLISTALLIFSTFYMLKKLKSVCKIASKSS